MFYLKLYFLFYEKLYFLIKFYKNVGGEAGQGKPKPRWGRGWGVNIHPIGFGDKGEEGNEDSGVGVEYTKPGPDPPRCHAY